MGLKLLFSFFSEIILFYIGKIGCFLISVAKVKKKNLVMKDLEEIIKYIVKVDLIREKVEKSHFLTFGKIVKGVICARTPYYI